MHYFSLIAVLTVQLIGSTMVNVVLWFTGMVHLGETSHTVISLRLNS